MSMCSRVTSMSSSHAERVILQQTQKNTARKINCYQLLIMSAFPFVITSTNEILEVM